MKTSDAWMIVYVIMVFVLSGCHGTHDVSDPGGMIAVMTGDELQLDASSPPTEIDLSTVANVYALANLGSPVLGGGINGLGYAYAENLSDSSISWNGATFTLGTAGGKNGVRQATVKLPAGNYSNLMLLATAVNGNWPSQTFVVNYTDGTHKSVVQSLSNWRTPQNYAGESKAFSFAYLINSTGGTVTGGPFYVYGYSFALDTSRTVQSLTLPNNVDVTVLAIDLIPTGTVSKAATPTMGPAPGTYSTAQSVTLSDTTPGATIYYTTNGTTPTISSAKYSSPIPVTATTTIEAIAVASGYTNSAVATGMYTIITSTSVTVGLSAVANVYALANLGSPVLGGGINGLGYAYAENLSGPSISWNGATFALGTAGGKNGVRQATVTLPAGNYSSLMLLATAVNRNWPTQTFVVNYTDGTHTSIVQSLSNWHTPQNYAGESKAFSFDYLINSTGGTVAGPFYLYGYSFALDTSRTVQSLTLPNNVDIAVLAIDLIPVSPTLACSPLTFGAIGDGTTDNTNAIQNAVNECAGQGGGIVELSVVGNNSTYLTGPFTLKSHVHLQIDRGVLLQGTHTHSRYVPAYINWVYQPNEALISAKGATDVAIVGAGIIDGAGDQPDPSDSGRTWYDLQPLESPHHSLRPWILEFYQCDHVTISGVTLRNAPQWNQALRFSSNVTESGVTIFAAQGPNTDGVDLVGVTNATLSDLNISVIDDDIAIKSGLPISTSDPDYPKEIGLPQMPTSNVRINNITATNGGGIAIGTETANGVNNVTIDGVYLTNTTVGFRIKTARDRGAPIYNISVNHLRMNVTTFTYVRYPIIIDSYARAVGPDPWGAAQPLTSTTPYIHDITIQDFVATNANSRSYIQGLPESCIRNLTLNAVSIQTTTGLGIDLHHITGTFTNVTSTPPPPFVVDQNVSVTIAGTTPPTTSTPPGTGQIACSSQGVPP